MILARILLPLSNTFWHTFCKQKIKKSNTFNVKFGFPMEFVDRRTLSRHNPTPPSRDTATYPLRCGGNRRLAMVRQLSPNSVALEAFTNNKQRMMELVYRAWDNISWEVMDKSWTCFFNNLRSIMQCRGDNNYKQAHNQGGKGKKIRVLRSILVWTTKTT